jgi:hypothetical protein
MIYISLVISLVIQIVVGVIDYLAIHIEVGPNDEILKDLIKVELFVQLIEFVFYVWILYYFGKVSRNITPFRYLDWSISTPLMLITLSAFLNHDGSTPSRLTDFLSTHTNSIVIIGLLNATMLFFGFMGELGYLNVYLSTALGFIPFVLNFSYIKETFLPSSEDITKNVLYYWFVFVWSLYGVFAVMKYATKNIGYNALDIFSKNFFGIFLAYIISSRSLK